MPSTYEYIAGTTLASASGSIIVSDIPQTYTDIKVIFWVPTYAGNGSDTFLRLNSDTSNLYDYVSMNLNNDNAATAVQYNAGNRFWINNQTVYSNTSYPTLYKIDIFGYSQTYNQNGYKTLYWTADQARTNSAGDLARSTGTYEGTAAITSLEFGCGSNFNTGTKVSVFGIKAA